MNISDVIRATRSKFVDEGLAESFFEINNGICDEFADEVKAAMGNDSEVEVLTNENFMDGGDFGDESWDSSLLEEAWGITPPDNLSWDDLNNIPFGGHDWLYHEGLHYDAECPDGVRSFFDLPIFRRYVEDLDLSCDTSSPSM